MWKLYNKCFNLLKIEDIIAQVTVIDGQVTVISDNTDIASHSLSVNDNK